MMTTFFSRVFKKIIIFSFIIGGVLLSAPSSTFAQSQEVYLSNPNYTYSTSIDYFQSGEIKCISYDSANVCSAWSVDLSTDLLTFLRDIAFMAVSSLFLLLFAGFVLFRAFAYCFKLFH